MNNLAHMATSSTLDNVAVGSEHETVVSDTSNLETTILEYHAGSILKDSHGQKLQRELAHWREGFTIADALAARPGIYTVAELAAGGCLSALSSVRCGFKHVWTTETDTLKAELAERLTRAPCIGDTFAHDYKQLRAKHGHVSYLKSGQPCTDWSSPGPHTGHGKDSTTGPG